jgi:DhnA family fructose-bisphosphate aldolase class Ia
LFRAGRTVMVQAESGAENPGGLVRGLDRLGVDAVVLSPGLLDEVCEECVQVAVVVRLNLAAAPGCRLCSVHDALRLGAEAVMLSVSAGDEQDLGRLGAVAGEARDLQVPLIVDLLHDVTAADVARVSGFGVDVIQVRPGERKEQQLRLIAKTCHRPLLAALENIAPEKLVRMAHACLEETAQGISVGTLDERILDALLALTHNAVGIGEALDIVGRRV